MKHMDDYYYALERKERRPLPPDFGEQLKKALTSIYAGKSLLDMCTGK